MTENHQDKMLIAILKLRSLRAQFDADDFDETGSAAALDEIEKIDDQLHVLEATTADGAIAALHEAAREWRVHHAQAGEPGHDSLSRLLHEALKLTRFMPARGRA